MNRKLVRLIGGLALGVALWPAPDAHAQGVTTGAITGIISDDNGAPLAGAQVQIINRSTGYSTGTLSRTTGLYLVQGLEVGGPYSVTVQIIGYGTEEQNDIRVTLSQSTRVDFQLRQGAVAIAGIDVVGTRSETFSPSKQGVSTLVTDEAISKLPTLSRDFLDLVKIAPQVVRPQDGNGFSAGGQYNRFNAYTIDGANQQDRFNLNSSGSVPGGSAGAKLISQDAVKEFRVMFTPTDVRQGNFTGMLVNAVTKNGTNDLEGGAVIAYRASDISAEPIRDQGLDIKQYGFHLGGPLIKDRLHFFIAPEWQERESPANGPFVGATEAARAPLISPDSISRIITIANGFGMDAGGTGLLQTGNPLTNLFGRIDFQINQQHRLVARQIWNKAEIDEFSRNFNTFINNANNQNSGFRLTSNAFTRESKNASSVVQLYSNFRNGWQNEFIAGYNYLSDIRIVPARTPEIAVGVTQASATGGASSTGVVTLGTEEFSPDNILRQKIFEVVNNLTIPVGVHSITVGGRFERDHVYNNFAQRSLGVWTFPSITAFQNSAPSGYTYGYSNSGDPADIAADFNAELYSVYAQDQWTVSDKLTVTAGLRADIPRLVERPLENDTIARYFSALGLRTSDTPKTRVLWSPRIGFNYDVAGDRTTQLRATAGIYTGPPPFILLGNAYANHGRGLVTLVCTSSATVPTFTLDIANQPKACAGQPTPQPGQAGTAGINHNDPDFKYPQSVAASAGFDKRLPGDVVFSLEGLYRKSINGVFVRDLNLRPRMAGSQLYTDRHGRVLYGDTASPTSTSWTINNSQNTRHLTSLRGVSFTEGMIDVTNQSKDYNYTISTRLAKQFGTTVNASVGYTYMQSKDVQSLTSDRAISNFRNGRAIDTSHEEMKVTTSYFERPHRLVASGTYTLPWKLTEISLFFEGISGTPFSYVTNGDINGDQGTTNDAIYIPRNATDVNEIRIGTGSGANFQLSPTEAQAFEDFIQSHECLNEQRGKVMERNSCRSPFQKRFDASIRQRLPAFRGQNIALQLDIFNVPNLINDEWGKLELPQLSANFPQQAILRVQGRTPGPLNQSLTNYSFDLNATQRTEGPFRIQTGTSNYWQMQMTLKYTF